MTTPLLGKVLVDAGFVAAEQLDRALEIQRNKGTQLGQILMEMGALSEDTLAVGLAQQVGFVLVDPAKSRVEPDLLSIISREKAQKWGVLPLYHTAPQVVRVAMTNPFDLDAQRDLEFLLGAAIEPVVCNARQLQEAIATHYGLERELTQMLESVRPQDKVEVSSVMDIDIQTIEERLRKGGARPYIDLLNFLLANAHSSRASDIHLDPMKDSLKVRYRIDGVLRSAMKLPKWVEPGLISRIKVVGQMDLSIHHKPQEGKIRATIAGRETDLRIATMPSQFGQRCVMRILDPSILEFALSDLGFAPGQLQTYYKLISQPQGIILVTGPTGSGKSTTLYATLNRVRTEQTSIVSIEDPVEYTMPAITQVQVDERRGMTYAAATRSLLRQDPNVLVIGEIRDKDTASAAFQAALTGHLVFSTLHTTDSISTITRLRDLGVPLYLIGSTLLGIVAQRLVRRLCPYCRKPGEPSAEAWEPLNAKPVPMPDAFVTGSGCRECLYTGYLGRMGVFETLRVDDSLRRLIINGADETSLRRAAEDAGLRTLVSHGVEKVSSGITTLPELARHIRSPLGSVHRPVVAQLPLEQTTPAMTPPPEPEPLPHDEPMAQPPQPAEDAAEETTSPSPDPGHETILVVDDSEEILDLVRYSLEGAGFRVLVARDGEEALETIEKHLVNDPVHLVVLDVMMPGLSGFEVCEQLKQDIATAFLPVLILSARGDQAHVKDGFRAGADDYLPKPFDPEELELRIRALLRRAYGGAGK